MLRSRLPFTWANDKRCVPTQLATDKQSGRREGGGVDQAYSRLSTTHGHITDCKLDSVVYAGVGEERDGGGGAGRTRGIISTSETGAWGAMGLANILSNFNYRYATFWHVTEYFLQVVYVAGFVGTLIKLTSVPLWILTEQIILRWQIFITSLADTLKKSRLSRDMDAC